MKTEKENEKEVLLAGPYRKGEEWMLENAVKQLGPIEHRIHTEANGDKYLYRTRKGYKAPTAREER